MGGVSAHVPNPVVGLGAGDAVVGGDRAGRAAAEHHAAGGGSEGEPGEAAEVHVGELSHHGRRRHVEHPNRAVVEAAGELAVAGRVVGDDARRPGSCCAVRPEVVELLAAVQVPDANRVVG